MPKNSVKCLLCLIFKLYLSAFCDEKYIQMLFPLFQFCPAGKKIYGANIKQEGQQGSGDDTATNGISFLCR